MDLPTRQIVLLTLLFCLAALLLMLALALPVFFARVLGAEARADVEDATRLSEQTPVGRMSYYGVSQTSLNEGRADPPAEAHELPMEPVSRTESHAASQPAAPTTFLTYLKRCAQSLSAYAGVHSLLRIGSAASLTTACVFWMAYEQVAEDYVAIGLQYVADQHIRLPECFAGSSKCISLYDPKSPASHNADEVAGTQIGGITASVLDLIVPLAALESDAQSLPPREPPRTVAPWTFARHGRALDLHSKDRAFALEERVPALLSGLAADASVFALSAVLIAALTLAGLASWLSFRRLTFARTRVPPRAEVSARQLAGSMRERVLVHYPQRGLEAKLRDERLREIHPGAELSSAPAFIANVERYMRDPAALIETIQRYPGRLILLSGVDWTRWLAPEEREALDQAFKTFVIVHGPGLTKWPELPTERRALASTLWDACNPCERSVLARLALDGYVAPHPDNESVVLHLRDRGILCRDRLAFAEPHFRIYVRYTASAAVLRSTSEVSAQQSEAWNRIRVPLSTATLLVLAIVSFMQPELTAVGLPISSALAAVRPLLKTFGISGE